MLRFGIEQLRACRATGRAVAAFSVYNAEQVVAVLRGAGGTTGVILQAGSSAFAHLGRSCLAGIALGAARGSGSDVGVHLDHSRELGEVEWCLEAGYTSVMFDGSHLDFETNVAATRDAVAMARRSGAWVEAELLGTPGDEDRSTNAVAATMTDPDMAAEFVARTGVDALAVSVGNVHGHTDVPPRLDLGRLALIGRKVEQPLVLHGASGVRAEDLRGALALGVAKANVNTELRRAFLASLPGPGSRRTDSLPDALAPAMDAMTRTAASVIASLDAGAQDRDTKEKQAK